MKLLLYFSKFKPSKLTDKEICRRFVECIKEIPETNIEKARKLKVNEKYLIQLPKKKSPQIKGSLLANFCTVYGYSPSYILLGQGTKKGEVSEDELKMMFRVILKEVKNRNKDTDIIEALLSGMLELKATWNNTHKQLVNKAIKHNKS